MTSNEIVPSRPRCRTLSGRFFLRLSMYGLALSLWGGCRGSTDSSAESTPVSADSEDRINEKAIDIIAFGDFGKANRMMTQTMDTYHSNFANPTMVFLLGDNSYNFDWEMTKTSQYTVFFDHVARKSSSPHYVILGNHDYELKVAGLMLKEMPFADSRWILPSSYYFKRFKRADFVLCVWFLDTEKFTIEQSTWFEKSLSGEKSTCTWTFVNGHHPGMIQASGAQYGSNFLSKYLEPILERHNVDV